MTKNVFIRCVGKNSEDVTGSCIHIKTPNREILLECGLWQSSGEPFDDYKVNSEPFDFKPQKIDYIFCNHTHIDHNGRIPLLFARGAHAPVIIPAHSYDITRILLEDSANIAVSNASQFKTKYKRDYKPLYTQEDVASALSHVKEYAMGEKVVLDEYVSFRFVPSGHILNAAQLELWITEGNLTKKIVYTSDLGNTHIHSNYGGTLEPVERCDMLIAESTYAGELRIATAKKRSKEVDKLVDVIRNTFIENRGKVLIPIFANSRLQEILTVLYLAFGEDKSFKYPIIVDTPMGIKICSVYDDILDGEQRDLWEKVMSWGNIRFTSDPVESRAWMKNSMPMVILSSSGMMTSGRSRAWCRELLPNSNNMIIFCGFSVENSLASIIKSGKAKKIKISGEWIPNRCKIVDLHTFSSHIQRDSMLDYYSDIDCQKILLVHGEKEAQKIFAEELQEKMSDKDKTGKVICSQPGLEINM